MDYWTYEYDLSMDIWMAALMMEGRPIACIDWWWTSRVGWMQAVGTFQFSYIQLEFSIPWRRFSFHKETQRNTPCWTLHAPYPHPEHAWWFFFWFFFYCNCAILKKVLTSGHNASKSLLCEAASGDKGTVPIQRLETVGWSSQFKGWQFLQGIDSWRNSLKLSWNTVAMSSVTLCVINPFPATRCIIIAGSSFWAEFALKLSGSNGSCVRVSLALFPCLMMYMLVVPSELNLPWSWAEATVAVSVFH